MFRALSVRNYRLYATGQVVSSTGTWMARVAQDWLVYHVLTNDSSFALGFVTALQFLPTLLFGMYGGILGDRYPKRRVLLCTQGTLGLISLLTGMLVATHTITLWSMCVIVAAFGTATALDTPVRQAFVIDMVGRDTVQNAVSLNSATFNLARMVGPAVAGLLIEAFGTAPAFFCNAVSYGAVIACLIAMAAKELHIAAPVARAKGQLREGFAYVRGEPRLLVPIVLMGAVGMFGFNFQITNALMAQGVFHKGAGGYGILSTMQALGSLAGALLVARRRTRPRIKLLVLAAVTFGGIEAFAGFMPSYLLFMTMLVPVGLSAIVLSTACNTTLQLASSRRMQARVMALYTTVFVGSKPIGSPLVGWLGGALGPRWVLFLGGAVCAGAGIGCALVYARSQRIELPASARLSWLRPAPYPAGDPIPEPAPAALPEPSAANVAGARVAGAGDVLAGDVLAGDVLAGEARSA